jgi:hypothetical protein
MKTWKWIVGLDYSMTCPAITIARSDIPFSFENCQLRYISDSIPKTKLPNIVGSRLTKSDYSSNEERFEKISWWAIHSIIECTGQDPFVAYIEDYSFGSKGKVFHIAENTGLVKNKLFSLGAPIFTIPPTVVKKFARGKGVGTKDQMYETFVNETGVRLMPLYQPTAESVGSPVGDLVDSYYICKYGYEKG